MKKIKWFIFKLMYKKELDYMHNLRHQATTQPLPEPLEYYLGIKSGIERTLYKLSGKYY